MQRQAQAFIRQKPEAARAGSEPAAKNARLKFGGEPKKVAMLVALVVVAGTIYLRQSDTSEATSSGVEASTPAGSLPKRTPSGQSDGGTGATQRATGRATAPAFKPSIKRRPNDAADHPDFDPTLRTYMLDKLADVPKKDGGRNLFDFYKAPVPVSPEPVAPVLTTEVAPVVQPPPPPIPLRFFGHTLTIAGGEKRVFCLLNDQVMTPSEGTVLQRRYKIEKILTASVLVEDLEDHHEQTLPIDSQAQTQAQVR
jgi:hypothetical protein